jgi:tetratricopeptide (TPR) repeat protein
LLRRLRKIRMKKLLALAVLGLGIASGAARADVQPAHPALPPVAPKAVAPKAAAPGPASPIQKKLEEALNRMDKNDDAGAIQILEALKKDPEVTPPVLALLGALYLKTNRPKEAMAILKPLADAADADPAVLFNAGRAAFALGQGPEGEHYLGRSVALAPGSPAARTLGLLLARQGRSVAAFDVLIPWVQANPTDFEARLATALLAANLQRLADAEELLKDLPANNPKVRLLKGDLALRKGDAKAAIATLRPLVDSPPPGFDTSGGMQLDARRLLADAYLRTGQSTEAVKLLAGKGGDAPTALLLARAQYQSGNLQAGLATLTPYAPKILKAGQPRDPDLVAEMALAYGRMLAAANRQPEAASALAVATRLDPDSTEAWQAYGQTLTALGKKDEAGKALARFRDLSAARTKAKAPAAPAVDPVVALMEKGELDKAVAAAREQIKATPKDLGPRALEVRILLLQKHPDEALKAAQRMVDLAPGSPDAIYARGVCQLALQKAKEAEADFRQALKLQPQYLPAMNDLAVLLMLQGQKAEARTLLQKVLKAHPDDKLAAENLKKLDTEGKAGG